MIWPLLGKPTVLSISWTSTSPSRASCCTRGPVSWARRSRVWNPQMRRGRWTAWSSSAGALRLLAGGVAVILATREGRAAITRNAGRRTGRARPVTVIGRFARDGGCAVWGGDPGGGVRGAARVGTIATFPLRVYTGSATERTARCGMPGRPTCSRTPTRRRRLIVRAVGDVVTSIELFRGAFVYKHIARGRVQALQVLDRTRRGDRASRQVGDDLGVGERPAGGHHQPGGCMCVAGRRCRRRRGHRHDATASRVIAARRDYGPTAAGTSP